MQIYWVIFEAISFQKAWLCCLFTQAVSWLSEGMFLALKIILRWTNYFDAQIRENCSNSLNDFDFYGGRKALVFSTHELLPYSSTDSSELQYKFLQCVKIDNKQSPILAADEIHCKIWLDVLAPKVTIKCAKEISMLCDMFMPYKIWLKKAWILLKRHKCQCGDFISVFKPHKVSSNAEYQQKWYQNHKEKHAEYNRVYLQGFILQWIDVKQCASWCKINFLRTQILSAATQRRKFWKSERFHVMLIYTTHCALHTMLDFCHIALGLLPILGQPPTLMVNLPAFIAATAPVHMLAALAGLCKSEQACKCHAQCECAHPKMGREWISEVYLCSLWSWDCLWCFRFATVFLFYINQC